MDESILELYYQIERNALYNKRVDKGNIMKLFICRKCQDVVRCINEKRTCQCGESSGYYTDDIKAVFEGEHCVPIGFDNNKLIKAIQMADVENKHQKEETTCAGVDFSSFVILNCSSNIKTK